MGNRKKGVKRSAKKIKRAKTRRKKSVSKMSIRNMIAGSGNSL